MVNIKWFTTAPRDVFIRISTYIVGPVIVLIPTFIAGAKNGDWVSTMVGIGGVLLAIYVIAYLFSSVSAYGIGAEQVIIRKPVGAISIPYSQIISIKTIEKLNAGFKVFANAGLFGYFGLFFSEDDNKTVGVYATCLKQMVRIQTTNGKTYYLSPAEPEHFVDAVKRQLNQNHQGGEKL